MIFNLMYINESITLSRLFLLSYYTPASAFRYRGVTGGSVRGLSDKTAETAKRSYSCENGGNVPE